MGVCFSRDPKVRIEFEAREKALKDKVSSLNYAWNEGYAKGYAKAKAEIEEARAKAEEVRAEAEKEIFEAVENMLPILDDQKIASIMELDISVVKKIREEGRY